MFCFIHRILLEKREASDAIELLKFLSNQGMPVACGQSPSDIMDQPSTSTAAHSDEQTDYVVDDDSTMDDDAQKTDKSSKNI